ncbi:MAG: sulfurtransferase TusA family protein [Methanoregula sp.]|nr:sulfurtransferase TusA family protein [Methanoregula sp.]
MTRKTIDISAWTSPCCLMVVAKEAKALKQSGELLITCNNFPAVTTSIPRIVREEGLRMETRKPSDGCWEIRLTKQ